MQFSATRLLRVGEGASREEKTGNCPRRHHDIKDHGDKYTAQMKFGGSSFPMTLFQEPKKDTDNVFL